MLRALVTVDRDAVEQRARGVLPAFPEVAAAYLFGSALADCRPESDLDLALIVRPERERSPDFSPPSLEGRTAAALGWVDGHPFHPTVLDRRRVVFAMQALRGKLAHCADETALADFIEFVSVRFPDADRRWRQALDDALPARPS